jgi:hypothetical protein
MPSATPQELASAIVETIEAGARNGSTDGPASVPKCPLPKTESLPGSPIVLGDDD